jgi:hypothetical protein
MSLRRSGGGGNIRPAQGNRSMSIEDPASRARVREITFALIGAGQPLP